MKLKLHDIKWGIYYDGYKHPDVVNYRQTFLDKIYNYKKNMAKYEGEYMEWIPLTLGFNEKEITILMMEKEVYRWNPKNYHYVKKGMGILL